jgi:Tol biopolymer transport system component
MQPTRLELATQICQAALRLGPAEQGVYLDGACGGDEELRREVEAMLVANSMQSTIAMTSPADFGSGLTIAHYRIESKLGEGGMGAVYRAFDSNLGRPVAIKFLSRRLADAAARRRFQQEAQTASSLNHPHIVTVHDAGEVDGRQYLVTEYVDGGTLKEWAAAERRSWKQVVALLTGVADGLAAAHEAGIVHRDIKPGNILVARNGYAKLGDFGLAKLAAGTNLEARGNRSPDLTRPGIVVGTIAYMSPEQASGQELDGRSDIFSFGVVLYELLAGRRPFSGATDLELLTSIAHAEPVPLGDDIPGPLRALVEKALEKDPDERYQAMREVVVDLKRAAKKPFAAPASEVRAPERRKNWRWGAIAGIGLAAVIVALVVSLRLYRSAPGNPLANAVFTRLTDFPGSENEAAISRDGRFFAFRSDRDGPVDTWSGQIGSGRINNLTNGTQPIVLVRNQGFSPDGSEIWLSSQLGGVRMRILPSMGGPLRPFLAEHAMDPAWSPDGSQIVYHLWDAGDPTFITDASGGNRRLLLESEGPGIHKHFPTWSKDGKWIYYVRGVWDTREMDIWRVPSSGGKPERMTAFGRDIKYLTPLDDRTILYTAPDEKGGGPWLWAFGPERRDSRRISSGLEVYTSVDASADGRRLVASIASPTANLWTFPIKDRPAEESDVKPLKLSCVRAYAPRYGGRALFYLSSSSGGDGLWRFENGESVEIWKGSNGPLFEPAAVSFDGRRVAIILRRQGKRTLHILSADGGDLQPVAESLDASSAASWSPDGKWIVAGGTNDGDAGLFKIPVEGGAPIRLAKGLASNPVWSPEGSVIAYTGPAVGLVGPLLLIDPEGKAVESPRVEVRVGGERYRFMPGRRELVYIAGAVQSNGSFWLMDLATKRSRRLSSFDGLSTRTFDVTPDGSQIVFDRLRENSDIALIELPARKN